MNLDEHVAENRAKLEKRDLDYWKRRANDMTMTNNDLILRNRQLTDRIKELEALIQPDKDQTNDAS